MRNLFALAISACFAVFIYFMITPDFGVGEMAALCICCGILIFLVWRWAVAPDMAKLPKYRKGTWWNTWKP